MSRRLGDIGRDLQARLKNFFDTPLDAAATPLEVCQAVVDDVELHVEPVGRGRRVPVTPTIGFGRKCAASFRGCWTYG